MKDNVVTGLVVAACIIGIFAGMLYIVEKSPRFACVNIPYLYSGCGVIK